MTKSRTCYEGLAWSFTLGEIGRKLRERFETPKELPPKLLALIGKLETVEREQPRLRLVSKLDAIEGT